MSDNYTPGAGELRRGAPWKPSDSGFHGERTSSKASDACGKQGERCGACEDDVPCACLECDYEKLRDRVPVVEPCASCCLGPGGRDHA